jgi:DNA helicase II / ATP-dependent DNA helicase PcrA
MDLDRMLDVIEGQSGRVLNDEQRAVVEHGIGPLWVIAGPGSGKTEVLVLRCLKLACVDGVLPRSIMLTTFTDKAAKNIQDRIAIYKAYLDEDDHDLKEVDLFDLRIGTLHSLCNDIMQEYRYEGYQNYRLLDELDQLLFVYEQSPLAARNAAPSVYLPFWRHFDYLATRYNAAGGWRWTTARRYLPHRWVRANAAVKVFNRIVEDRIDVSQLYAAGDVFGVLADAYEAYRNALEDNYTCDFAHLQLKFFEFLNTPNGDRFVNGEGSIEQPGLRHVLVDEYQDTNPIQEAIYLRLAQPAPHNLTVVGDDDQALYRFRGGTVECMVGFDIACQRAWGAGIEVISQPLSTNFRAHPDCVSWCDNYITSFSVMNRAGARAPGKPNLRSDLNWTSLREDGGANVDAYPAVSYVLGRNSEHDAANRFAETVRGLLDSGVVQNPSHCVLLLKSSRENAAGVYRSALEQRGISVYNPRARTFLGQEEVQVALGAVLTILDPDQRELPRGSRGLNNVGRTISRWMDAYDGSRMHNPELSDYVDRATERVRQTSAGERVTQLTDAGPTQITASLQDVFYHVISFEPFVSWQRDPERTVRLGRLSQVIESYSSLPFPGRPGTTRGDLRTDASENGRLHQGQLRHLYNALVGLLVSEGLNDPEDDEVICPPGRFPIMTVHQAKGLEFPFVFVSRLGVTRARVGDELLLEDELRPFSNTASTAAFSPQVKADQDYIRLFYVAYSRAEYALVLLTTASELREQGLGFGGYGRQWFNDNVEQIS